MVGWLVDWLVGWCFQPSQPLGVTSGLDTNSNLSLSYSAHKSLISTTSFLQHNYFKHTHTHTHTQLHIFLQNHKPQRTISGLKTNFSLSPRCSIWKKSLKYKCLFLLNYNSLLKYYTKKPIQQFRTTNPEKQ